jgi:cytochrome c peroxidase
MAWDQWYFQKRQNTANSRGRNMSGYPGKRLFSLIALSASLTACGSDTAPPAASTTQLTAVQQLGKAMFFDANLSTPSGMACATCHDPAAGFADPDTALPVSKGIVSGTFGSRNAPSVTYAAFSPPPYHDPVQRRGMMMGGLDIGGQFWDGRAASLAEQAKGPLMNPLEMHNLDKSQVMSAIRNSSYAALFEQVYGAGSLSADNVDAAFEQVAAAISEYEKSNEVSPFTSKFDYYLAGKVALTAQEAQGYALFTGKANCVNCHAIAPVGPNDPVQQSYLFTNFAHQNIGVPKNPGNPYYAMLTALNPDGSKYVDFGHGAVTGVSTENGKFKIPSLRNVAITPPYMHNGVFHTLREVVVFDNTRDERNASWPPPEVPQNVHRHMPMADGTCEPNTLGCLKLTDEEVDAIVAFLTTLTDGYKIK